MKNKKKQWIKGIMLSTFLGLGWSITGDISHAAGKEISQIEVTPEWIAEKTYNIGDIVTYKGIQYVAQQFSKGNKPNANWQWKSVNGYIPKWHRHKTYEKGDIVTYKGIQYVAQCDAVGEQPDVNWQWILVTQ
ncbi:carbohydrate-binding protein [Bacillus cereus]|nr:carbohydrate-binding protein [Bacillus cereus]